MLDYTQVWIHQNAATQERNHEKYKLNAEGAGSLRHMKGSESNKKDNTLYSKLSVSAATVYRRSLNTSHAAISSVSE